MRPKSTILYGLLVMVIGALLIAFNSNGELLTWVVILAGISLIVPCLYTLISTVSDERRARKGGMSTFSIKMMTFGVVLTSAIGIGMGIWLVAAPNFFIRFIAYAFAVLLIVYGIYHVCVVVWMCRPANLSMGYYVIPMLMILAGLIILFTPLRTIKSVVIIVTGFGLIGSGISSILEYVAASSAYRRSIAADENGGRRIDG